jgi:hypothetical protein
MPAREAVEQAEAILAQAKPQQRARAGAKRAGR